MRKRQCQTLAWDRILYTHIPWSFYHCELPSISNVRNSSAEQCFRSRFNNLFAQGMTINISRQDAYDTLYDVLPLKEETKAFGINLFLTRWPIRDMSACLPKIIFKKQAVCWIFMPQLTKVHITMKLRDSLSLYSFPLVPFQEKAAYKLIFNLKVSTTKYNRIVDKNPIVLL